MNPVCGPDGRNAPVLNDAQLLEAQNQAQRNRGQTYPEYVGMTIGQAVAQRIAYRVTNGLEYVFWGGVDQVKGAYHWACPTRPEHVRRAAQFSRREIDGFISKAARDSGAQHIMLQPHRVPENVRQTLRRDGYQVEEVEHMKQPAVKISWQ